jgi:hypothetical protein
MPRPANLKAKLNNQILHQQRLKRLGMNKAGRVTADAFKLMKHALNEAGTTAGWALGHRDQATHKGGSMLLFHHF